MLAEELECDWKKVRTEFPGVSREFGPMQGVFGSQSVRTSYDSLRKAGAAAREMLVQAAATQWGVAPKACRAENNAVVNTATNARLSYGSLAEAAGKLPPPASPALKDPAQYRLLGKPLKRLDTPAKVDGSAQFGIDVRLPGMLYAVVARCPVFGGKVKSFDATKSKAMAGVKQIVQISNGIAVVADNTWNAMQGRRVLAVEWDEGPVAAMSTPALSKIFLEKMGQPGAVARTGWRRARRHCRRRAQDRSRLRGPLPGPRSHGAAQLHRGREARPLLRLGLHAGTERRRRHCRACHRTPARSDRRAYLIYGRRLRPPRRRRLHRRSRRGLQSSPACLSS